MAPHSSTPAWKIHGRRSLVACSPWGCKESDTTEQLHIHFSLSCIGEGNGNPLQCSCLENPRDGGAWWAAVYGVAQSRTQLKRLSSSSSSMLFSTFCSNRQFYSQWQRSLYKGNSVFVSIQQRTKIFEILCILCNRYERSSLVAMTLKVYQ